MTISMPDPRQQLAHAKKLLAARTKPDGAPMPGYKKNVAELQRVIRQAQQQIDRQ